jgi:hypothetical protein
MNRKYSKSVLQGLSALILIISQAGWLPGSVFLVLAAPGDTVRVSVDSSGAQSNGYSHSPAISGNKRYVVFDSEANNLVAGDTNDTTDIFVHDLQTGATTRVSLTSSGTEANGPSSEPSISSDGRYVSFYSEASNLVADDTNGVGDVFVRDTQAGTTTRVSVDSAGVQADGTSYTYYNTISSDGNLVTFVSEATNLVADDTNGVPDIFVHNLQAGTTTRVSIDSTGAQANQGSGMATISGNGRYVAFYSEASNLVSDDTNGLRDVFVHDLQGGATVRVSVSSSGVQGDHASSEPSISSDGRYVAFKSAAENLDAGDTYNFDHIYVRDVQASTTSRVSRYSDGSTLVGWSSEPSISSDGRYVAFAFDDRGDGEGLYEIFVHDRQSGATVNASHGGTSSEDSSFSPSISADGQLVAFGSVSSRLVSGDTNGASDIFVHENADQPGPPTVVSIIRSDTSPTAADNVHFTVTFSEAVTGVGANDFTLTTTGSLAGATVADVSGSNSVYTVTVNTGTGDGTLRLDVPDNDGIFDTAGNPLGGTGAGNGSFTTGEVYTVDKNVPSVTSSLRADPDPTTADSVHFNVTFSEAVTGVDASDFALTSTGSIVGTAVTDVSGSGTAYTVTVNTGTGDGTLRLDVIDNDSIVDEAGYPLGGTGVGNGNFTTGEAYTFDRTAPSVTSSLRADPDPTTADSVRFNVTFSEAVTGVDASDFSLVITGGVANAAITGVSGSSNVYTVTVGTGLGNGTIHLDVLDDDSIIDASGYPLGGTGAGNGNFMAGETYTINKAPVTRLTYLFRSNGNNDGWVLESSEDSNVGGSKKSNGDYIYVGDDAQDRQYRAILHFPTTHLPDNAVIVSAYLMLKKYDTTGTDPFTTHQNMLVDIKSGPYGTNFLWFNGLQVQDFEAPASQNNIAVIQNNPIGDWYWTILDKSCYQYINLTGVTQLRLRFELDDNDDQSPDFIKFYSGNDNDLSNRPRLLIDYYVP